MCHCRALWKRAREVVMLREMTHHYVLRLVPDSFHSAPVKREERSQQLWLLSGHEGLELRWMHFEMSCIIIPVKCIVEESRCG